MLAVLFATGVLNVQLPAVATDTAGTVDGLIQYLATVPEAPARYRAYHLLNLANALSGGATESYVLAQFSDSAIRTMPGWRPETWQSSLQAFVESCAMRAAYTADTRPPDDKEKALALSAIDKALMIANESSDKFSRPHFYLMAALLYQKLGCTQQQNDCYAVLAKTFSDCEHNPSADPDEIKAAASVLNIMALRSIPLKIDVYKRAVTPAVAPYSDEDFAASEKLKLRAAAIVDRLPADEDVRRRVHRDLALWYKLLGKNDRFEEQKQILFQLVGTTDERILYPTGGACGRLTWWATESAKMGLLFHATCGMG